MFKRLMSLGLLCLAFDASASIVVTTTADENGTNTSACSLREAIAITNSSDLTKGFGGCTNPDGSTVIIVKASSTYPVNSELLLTNSVTIQSSTAGDLINNTDGTDNPVIQAIGAHRIFNIKSLAANTALNVAITNVNLSGCGVSSGCETQGGVITSQGSLSLNSMRIYNGVADRGGAIYNENIGKLTITNSELKSNTAKVRGAAIYTIQPAFVISKSLIRDNKIENPTETGFAIHTELNDPIVGKSAALLTGSTIYNNKASAINIVSGVLVNSSTIIGNQGGVTLNAPSLVVGTTVTSTSALANTIIASNNGLDCTFVAGDKTPINNVAYTNSCNDTSGLYGTFTAGQDLSGKTLIAGDSSETNGGAVCALPPTAGLLCPFHIYSGHFTGYFLPRLIPAPNATLAGEPVVNKGNNTGSGQGCSDDQRGLARVLCDIGAIELVIPAGNAQTNGLDIVYGQVASIDLSPVVGDGQLIPAAYCSTLYNASAPPQGGAWLDGCVRYITSPAKGVATYEAAKNLLTYTPSSNFHGYDKFSYTITTSTSFFSDAQNDKTITLTTTIVQAPPAGITSKTVGAGSGSVFAVFALMVLALRRRLTGGRS